MQIEYEYLNYEDSIQEQVRKINLVSTFFGYYEIEMKNYINEWYIVVNKILTYLNEQTEYNLPYLYRDEHLKTWIDKTNRFQFLMERLSQE